MTHEFREHTHTHTNEGLTLKLRLRVKHEILAAANPYINTLLEQIIY